MSGSSAVQCTAAAVTSIKGCGCSCQLRDVEVRGGQAFCPPYQPHACCPLIPSPVLSESPASFSCSPWHPVPNPLPALLLAHGTHSFFPGSCGTWKGLSPFSQYSTVTSAASQAPEMGPVLMLHQPQIGPSQELAVTEVHGRRR